MNDSLRSDIFVRYGPETVACACIYLGARLLQIPLPNHPAWYKAFKVEDEHIEDAARRILVLYTRPKVDVEKVETVVEELRMKQQESKKLKLLGVKGISADTEAVENSMSKSNSVKEEDVLYNKR